MNKPAIFLTIAMFVLLLVGMSTYTFLKKQELQRDEPSVTDTKTDVLLDTTTTSGDVQIVQPSDVETSESGLVLSKRFVNDTHFLSGTLTLPTPCHYIASDYIVAESFPEQVQVTLTTQEAMDPCAQVMTDHTFEIIVQVSEHASFDVTLDGQPVALDSDVVE